MNKQLYLAIRPQAKGLRPKQAGTTVNLPGPGPVPGPRFVFFVHAPPSALLMASAGNPRRSRC